MTENNCFVSCRKDVSADYTSNGIVCRSSVLNCGCVSNAPLVNFLLGGKRDGDYKRACIGESASLQVLLD